MPAPNLPETIAALDLGSNSFHMVVARIVDGQLQVVDRHKEMVRLAAGLDQHNDLSQEAQDRALAALRRFGERVRGMEDGSVRAVGTNTLRKAKSARGFLAKVEEALGHPVEVISGLEEARLVYMGVAYSLQGPGKRLVIDIGGGSTEFIIGTGFEPEHRESKYMGCVAYSQRFFPDGQITELAMEAAILAARQELAPTETVFKNVGWKICIGASGTNRAIATILEANGWTHGAVTLAGMQKIRKRLLKLGTADPAKLRGLSEDRAPVFAGGLAILIGAFESLGIKRMVISDGALREGLMYDLFGRIRQEDIRDRTVRAMCARYGIDPEHARRVEDTAMAFYEQVSESWSLDKPRFKAMLRWTAQLHEIGLAVNHSNHHKHGSYLVENSDMPGFSREDQQLMWAMVRSHRRSFKPHRYESQPSKIARAGRRLTILLRLAVLLNRSRIDDAVPTIGLEAHGRTLALEFSPSFLDAHPLTRAALRDEASLLSDADYELAF